MLNKKTKVIILMLMFFAIFMLFTKVNAITISQVDYTEEYKEWLELSNEEREKTIAPKMFDIDIEYSNNNILTKLKTLMSSLLDSRFDLRDKISNNLKIKNQGTTNACWTFATLSSLETNLALKGNSNKVYDFSESHMDYSTSQSFTDGEIEYGFSREVSKGGNFQIGTAYLTNGMGAVLEEDMPFINTMEDISIKEIKDKEVVTKVTDTEDFGTLMNSIAKDELMLKMKEHIKENGSISAGIFGANLFGTNLLRKCYNNETGAIYCDSSIIYPMDHNVSIIGWDDNYSKNNFHEDQKPSKDGAWIIRNSWGTEAGGIRIGDNGFMYVSYEDANIYKQLFGIEKASQIIDYDNIYQYNELGYNNALTLSVNKIYVASVFERDRKQGEELSEVALNVMQKVKCKVYVNPNSDSKKVSDLEAIMLEEGETETFDAGYHTLEFKNPIKLTGDKFVVVVEIEALDSSRMYCPIISKTTNNLWDNVKAKENANYITYGEFFEKNNWIDTVENASNISAEPSNLTIKAFTKEVEVVETPTVKPTQEPTTIPTVKPTTTPTQRPTSTVEPTTAPTVKPTITPTQRPTSTVEPTTIPTLKPTDTPTQRPTSTVEPTTVPTVKPTTTPTQKPTSTVEPTTMPTVKPTATLTTNTPTPTNNSQIIGSINTNSNNSGSTMTTHSSLPYVGKTELILGLIIILTINMVVVYKKYKKIY